MKITVVGSGYVGLVTGACLADVGNDVLCLDLDLQRVETLQRGEIPIHEPGLLEVVTRNAAAGRMAFTADVARAVHFSELQLIAVGTPPDEKGAADLQYVLSAARNIGRHMTDRKLVINKSTVPVGTADQVQDTLADELSKRGVELPYSVASNPEFLKEGAALADFTRPDRIIVGSNDARAVKVIRDLYAPFNRNSDRLFVMDVRSAELTKYAANAMLATRISFMNELANLAERFGADIEMVRLGIGSDPRIGTQFLYPGCGYGGSCFPKDVRALLSSARQRFDIELRVLGAVEAANEAQKLVLADKVRQRLGADLKGRHFALWGLAFKPNTDDMREAPSGYAIRSLVDSGATVAAYDPVAMPEARRVLGPIPGLSYSESPMSALEGADALLIATEWKQFRSPDFDAIAVTLKQPLIFDGRNLYSPQAVRDCGIEYLSIGR